MKRVVREGAKAKMICCSLLIQVSSSSFSAFALVATVAENCWMRRKKKKKEKAKNRQKGS